MHLGSDVLDEGIALWSRALKNRSSEILDHNVQWIQSKCEADTARTQLYGVACSWQWVVVCSQGEFDLLPR